MIKNLKMQKYFSKSNKSNSIFLFTLIFFLRLSSINLIFAQEVESPQVEFYTENSAKTSEISENINQQNETKKIDYSEKLSTAIEKARELKLWEDPYWHTLMHYKKSTPWSYKSLIDDPQYFLAKNGKKNPQAELEATLQAFFAQPIIPENSSENENNSENPESHKKSDGTIQDILDGNSQNKNRHSTARFPGRYLWLREKLGLSREDFPYDGDLEYDDLMSKLVPENVYLVFPAGYMKNPASVFGHTFLLVESKGQPRLLANTVNYGANAGGVSGILYAVLGLTGGFRGYYGFTPYYNKVRDYNAIDMRDMWEYKLNLTDAEKDRMIRHILDMSGIYSRYFFITENCSYNLLFLFEAAKPETKATTTLSGAVEPIETVKMIHKLGFFEDGNYSPSLFSKVEYYKTFLTKAQNKFAKNVCLGKKSVEDFNFPEMSNENQAMMWELCAQYLQYLLSNGKIKLADYRKRYISVLSARRKLGKFENLPEPQEPGKPHLAHGSKKIAAIGGYDNDGIYGGLQWRLTAHNQLENPQGYSENSQLEFFTIDARIYDDLTFKLKKADFADVISLPASDRYFLSTCFHGIAGFEQNSRENENSYLAFRAKLFQGLSFRPAKWFQYYAMLGPDCYINPAYDYWVDLLLGGEIGFITTFGPWKNKMFAQVLQSPLDLDHFRGVFAADERIVINQTLNISANYSFNVDYENYWHEFGFGININY